MKIALHKEEFKAKPSGTRDIETPVGVFSIPTPAFISREITKTQVNISMKSLSEYIGKGCSFTCCSFSDSPFTPYPARIMDNFNTLYMVGLDLDSGVEYKGEGNPNVFYETFSSTSSHPKYRLLFKIPPVRDLRVAQQTILYFQEKYKDLRPDIACKDPVRIFYGTDKEVVYSHGEEHQVGTLPQVTPDKSSYPELSYDEDTFYLMIKNMSYERRKALSDRMEYQLSRLEDESRSRYMCVWHTSLMFAKIGIPRGISREMILEKISSLERYDDWDKSPEFVFGMGFTYGMS